MSTGTRSHVEVVAGTARACFDGATRITPRREIDAGVFVPRPIRRFLTETGMKTSVREVEARVERPAS